MTQLPTNAYTLLDVGSSRTTLALALPAQDGHHICAQVSVPSASSFAASYKAAAAELEALTGWRIPSNPSRQSQRPQLIATGSAGARPRAAVLTAEEKELNQLLDRLRARGLVEVVASTFMGRGGDSGNLGVAAGVLLSAEADVMVLSPGSKSTAQTMADLLALVHASSASAPESILIAGAVESVQLIENELRDHFQITNLGISWSTSHVRNEKLVSVLSSLNATGDTASYDAALHVEDAARIMASAVQGSVCIIDAGGANTTIALGTPAEPDKNAQPSRSSRRSAGVMSGAIGGAVNLDAVRAWLPFDLSEDQLRDYLANRGYLSAGISGDVNQLMIEQAVARVCGQATLRIDQGIDFIVGTGSVATYPRVAQAALTLLDIVQPTSPCRILVDSARLLSRLVPLSRADADAGLSLLKSDTFINAGVCLSVLGKGKAGDSIGEIGIDRLTASDEPLKEEIHTIRYGTITRIPLQANEHAGIRVTTSRKYSFGIELTNRPWATKSAELPSDETDSIAGGVLGLIIDARGRPLSLDDDVTNRQARLTEWLTALEAYDSVVFSRLD